MLRYDGGTGAFVDVFVGPDSGSLQCSTFGLTFTETNPTTLNYGGGTTAAASTLLAQPASSGPASSATSTASPPIVQTLNSPINLPALPPQAPGTPAAGGAIAVVLAPVGPLPTAGEDFGAGPSAQPVLPRAALASAATGFAQPKVTASPRATAALSGVVLDQVFADDGADWRAGSLGADLAPG